MKFELFESNDCGCSYQKDRDTDDIDALRPRMCELDAAGERWYVTEDGKDTNVCCAIHRAIMSDIGIKTPNVKVTGSAPTDDKQGEEL